VFVHSRSNWNLEVLVFEERGNRSTLKKNLSEQGWEPKTNSTHIWHRDRDSTPGHIGGRHALSPLPHPCSPVFFSNWIQNVQKSRGRVHFGHRIFPSKHGAALISAWTFASNRATRTCAIARRKKCAAMEAKDSVISLQGYRDLNLTELGCITKRAALKGPPSPKRPYCFQMVLLFFSRSNWLPEYSCDRENCHVNWKQIGRAMLHRFTLRSCPNLRPQFTNR